MVFRKIKEKIIGLIEDFKLWYYCSKLEGMDTDLIDYQPEKKEEEEYNTRGMKETCLNCGKKSCALAGVGNKARIN